MADVVLWRFKMCISFVNGNPTWHEFGMIVKESTKVQEIVKEPISSIKFVYTCTAVTISGFWPTNITRYKRIDS